MREIRMNQAINEALHEEMGRDDTVFILGESICQDIWGTHEGLADKFGRERMRDTPICEGGIVGTAVGAALGGYRPVADIMFGDFFFLAAEELLNHAATHRYGNGGNAKVPMVVKTAVGGFIGGGPMHSQCPEGLVWHRPGLKLVFPSTPYDAKGLMKTAIQDNNPVVYLYHKLMVGDMGEVPEEEYTIPFGVADVKKQGTDVTVVAIGYMVTLALEVAARMEDKGLSVEVIDPRTLEPLDMDTIVASVKKTGRVVLVDEDVSRCGVTGELGMQIMEQAFDSLKAPIQRVAAANLPIPAGYLDRHVLPQADDIEEAITRIV